MDRLMGHRFGQRFLRQQNNVQDWAFEEFLDDMRGYTKVEGNLDFVGQVNQRRINDGQPLEITEAGVMAASHRQGQLWVSEYFKWAADGDKMADRGEGFPDDRGYEVRRRDMHARANQGQPRAVKRGCENSRTCLSVEAVC